MPPQSTAVKWLLPTAVVFVVTAIVLAIVLGRKPDRSEPVRADDTTAKPLVVASDGSGDFRTLREALAAAPEGAEIVLRPGIYSGSVLLDKNVRISGGSTLSEVIFDGGDGPAIVVSTDTPSVRRITVRGRGGPAGKPSPAVEIAGGAPVFEDCDFGSGSPMEIVRVHGPANPTFRNCLFRDGQAAGVLVEDGAKGVFDNCSFLGCSMGAAVLSGADPVFRNCRFRGSAIYGILVYEKGRGRFEKCDFFENVHFGAAINEGGNAVFVDCRIHDNKGRGLSLQRGGLGTFERCEFAANDLAGVDIGSESHPVFKSCTIKDNREAGVAASAGASGTFDDCILLRNRSGNWKLDPAAKLTVRNSSP